MEATIPIREISRLTGVNSVTLRAWERRYGLIKPLRTAKGHRLYRHKDVELVKTIQAWLLRGLAIGKVSELLDKQQFISDVDIENIWHDYLNELLLIIAEFNLGKLDAFFNTLFSVYPAALIADKLIVPSLNNLAHDYFGNRLKTSVISSRLSEYLMMLTQRQRQQASGKRVAIAQLNVENNFLLNVLLHCELTNSQLKSELIGLISVNEAIFAVEKLSLDAIIVYNNSCSSLVEFQKDLVQLSQKISIPIIVGGNLISALSPQLPSNILLAAGAGQQVIIEQLSNLFSGKKESGVRVR